MQPLGLGLYPLNSGDIWLLGRRSGQMSRQTSYTDRVSQVFYSVRAIRKVLSIALVRANARALRAVGHLDWYNERHV